VRRRTRRRPAGWRRRRWRPCVRCSSAPGATVDLSHNALTGHVPPEVAPSLSTSTATSSPARSRARSCRTTSSRRMRSGARRAGKKAVASELVIKPVTSSPLVCGLVPQQPSPWPVPGFTKERQSTGVSGSTVVFCWNRPSAFAGINCRFFLGSTVGFYWDRPQAAR
jgi:hypothetical protein